MSEDGAELIDLISSDDEDLVLIDRNDDLISCQICSTKFDEGQHVPKYLKGCKHFFCLTCIKSLGTKIRKKTLTCPSCRATSNLGKKKFEDLATNHVVLRLKVVEEKQRKGMKGTNQKWCSECNTAATKNCICKKHQIANFDDIYKSQSLFLKEVKENLSAEIKDINKINQLVVKFNDSSKTAKAVQLKTQDCLHKHRNGLDFLITLLKGLKPPEGHLPKRQGKEPAESDIPSVKKMKLQDPTDQLISTENVLREVDSRVQQEVMNLESKDDSNSIVTETSVNQQDTYNAVEKGVSQYHSQQNNSRVTWLDVTIQLQNNTPLFPVEKLQHFLKDKKQIDIGNLFCCKLCKKAIGDCYFYCCLDCNDYQLCVYCNETHPHKIQLFGFDVSNDTYQFKIRHWVSIFYHAITCNEDQCASPFCGNVKAAFVHSKNCLKSSCSVCDQLLSILIKHGMACTNVHCRVPHCRYFSVRDLIGRSIQQDTVYMHQTMTSQNGTPSSYGGQGMLTNNYNMPYPMYYSSGYYQ
uniref:RING-type domain-containing protein n=1 Tax=Daphnia galeata TaxID=27404 RepID=A0A8J2RSY8_9CRUS|nr:unnamed protein product [Daphnia galeata]